MPPLALVNKYNGVVVLFDDGAVFAPPIILPATWRREPGSVSPIPTFPLFKIVIASVAPAFPTRKCISAPVVPTPVVVCKVRLAVVDVPPITSGVVIFVVNIGVVIVGEVENTRLVLAVPVVPVAALR